MNGCLRTNSECAMPAGIRNARPMITPMMVQTKVRNSLLASRPETVPSLSNSTPTATPVMIAAIPAATFQANEFIWASYPVRSSGNATDTACCPAETFDDKPYAVDCFAAVLLDVASDVESSLQTLRPASGKPAAPMPSDGSGVASGTDRGARTSPSTKSSSVQPNRSQIISNLSISGYALPDSHLEMAWRETPSSMASRSCVKLRCARRYCRLSRKLIVGASY